MPALFAVPSAFLGYADRGEGWAQWLDRLSRLVREVVAEWELAYDGPPMHGSAALVVPVRTRDDVPAVLKLAWPHDEEEHEHLGLQALRGDGVVRMYRADPRRHVMLLERLHADRDLTAVPVLEACAIAAGFYPRLHVPALPQLRTLAAYVDRWNTDMTLLPRDAPLPRRLVDQSISLASDFVADPATNGTMIHGDLHYENVLAADREPWLVIDPKPMSGDPHYEVAPLLWNRWDEVVASGDVREAVRRRFHTVVDAAGLDEGRARDWVVVRMAQNAMWTLHDAAEVGRVGRGQLSPEDLEWITMCVAVAKAVQD